MYIHVYYCTVGRMVDEVTLLERAVPDRIIAALRTVAPLRAPEHSSSFARHADERTGTVLGRPARGNKPGGGGASERGGAPTPTR